MDILRIGDFELELKQGVVVGVSKIEKVDATPEDLEVLQALLKEYPRPLSQDALVVALSVNTTAAARKRIDRARKDGRLPVADDCYRLRGSVERVVRLPYAQRLPQVTEPILSRLPSMADHTCCESRLKVLELASKYGLDKPSEDRRYPRFESGDAAYWAEQRCSHLELHIEFLARALVIEAMKPDARIADQGELSHSAKPWVAALHLAFGSGARLSQDD